MTWLGHSTVFLETAGQQILTDPVLRAGIGPVRRRPRPVDVDLAAVDAVLISHFHHDHLDLPSLRQLPRSATLIVPRGGGPVVRSVGFAEVLEFDAGDSVRIGGVDIKAVPALHSGRRMPFGPVGPPLGYMIRGDAEHLLRRRHGPLPGDARHRAEHGSRDPARGRLGAHAPWRPHGPDPGSRLAQAPPPAARGGGPLGNAVAGRPRQVPAGALRGAGPRVPRRSATGRPRGRGRCRSTPASRSTSPCSPRRRG